MANIIPPLVSDSPPPPPSEDEEDDEFDDFRESNDVSYGCDSFSITSSPEQSPKKIPKEVPSSKHESEFNFDPETPKTIIINSKEIVQMNDGKLSKVEEKDVNALEENVNELSVSELSSSSKHLEADCNNILFKNNFVNKDLDDHFKENIPSQLIFENKNFNQENEVCDNSNKISKMNTVVLKEDKSNELNLSNRHAESTLKTYSSDFSLHTADLVDSHTGGSILDSELSISTDLKSSNIDNIQNTTLENHVCITDDLSTEILQNSDEVLNQSVTIHSKNESTVETPNLVKDDMESDSIKNEHIHNVDSHSSQNSSLENDDLKNVSSNLNFKSEAADYGFNISHPTSLEPNFNSLEIDTRSDTVEDSNDSMDSKDSVEVQDIEIKNDFTSFIANSETILNLPPNNNEVSDFENFSMYDSKNEEVQVQNTKSDSEYCFKNISNTLETSTEEFANFSTFFPTDVGKSFEKKSLDKDNSSELGDFTECPPQLNQAQMLDRNEKVEDNFEDFAAFSVNPEPSDDEFGDFGDFTSSTFDSQNQQSAGISTQNTNYPLLTQKEAFIKAQEVIKDIFIPVEEVLDDFQHFELAKDDIIFNQIQNITDTPALSYHWSKSTSQKLLLKSLNIDSRNILYSGHSRHPSVPRFAANLGLQPLEPVKMEPLTPTPSTTPTPPITQLNFQSQTETQEVHNAEFDWTSSGLVNPLDYCQTTLLDLEQLVASLDIPSSSPNYPTLSPTKIQEDWDIWLECGSAIPEDSKNDLHADNFEEFTSFQSSEPSQLPTGWPNVPLRETYISEVTQSHIDVDVFLQPTIVTPEMPRKMLSTDEEPAFPETSVDVKYVDSKKDDEVEFDDFQMSAPVSNKVIQNSKATNVSSGIEEKEPNKSILEIPTDENYPKNVDEFTKFQNVSEEDTRRKSLTYTFNNALMVTPSNVSDINKSSTDSSTKNYFTDSESVSTNFDTFLDKNLSNTSAAQEISAINTFVDPSISKDTEEYFTKNVIENSKLHDENATEKDDDDFTEFHSSAPLPPIQTPMTMPVLEPLKPTLVYSNTPSSQINWPEPGITELDIRKFEEAFPTPIGPKNEGNPKKELHVNKTKATSPQLKKSNTTAAPRTEFPMWDTSPVHKLHKKLESKKVEIKPADEDEWSDFVSVAKSSPVHKTKLSDRNQTSSPDLTLSVLNLGNIQPAKQPIPVITAQGLVQTRLSTNMNTVSNHKSNLIIPRQLPQSQPSIISNQFASQAYNVGFNAYQSYNFSSNPPQSSSNQKSSQAGSFVVNGQEDDEWGDFVSSPLPPPHLQNSSTTMGHHSWNQFVPNSRSNAGQFLSGNEMRSNLVIQKKTSQVPGLVLPELDFLALKERTGVSKKK